MRSRAALSVTLVSIFVVLVASVANAGPVIHSRTVHLRHAAVDGAMHLLHWDDINGLPPGVVAVTGDVKRHSLRIEGTDDGIAEAVQAIDFVDIVPRHVRITTQFVFLRGPAPLASGRKTPTAQAVVDAAFRTISAQPASVDNNVAVPVQMRVVRPVSGAQYVDTGISISPRVNDNGTVTLRGTATWDTLLADLGLTAASPDAMGMIELVRTAPSGKTIVIGGFRVRPSAKPTAKPIYLYVLVTPES